MLAAAALTACNKNEEAAVVDYGQVRFTLSIGKEAVAKPQSRASGIKGMDKAMRIDLKDGSRIPRRHRSAESGGGICSGQRK